MLYKRDSAMIFSISGFSCTGVAGVVGKRKKISIGIVLIICWTAVGSRVYIKIKFFPSSSL